MSKVSKDLRAEVCAVLDSVAGRSRTLSDSNRPCVISRDLAETAKRADARKGRSVLIRAALRGDQAGVEARVIDPRQPVSGEQRAEKVVVTKSIAKAPKCEAKVAKVAKEAKRAEIEAYERSRADAVLARQNADRAIRSMERADHIRASRDDK